MHDATPDITCFKTGRSTGSQLNAAFTFPVVTSGFESGSLHTVAGTAPVLPPKWYRVFPILPQGTCIDWQDYKEIEIELQEKSWIQVICPCKS